MADEEHVNILRKGVEEWNAWRAQNPRVIPDLKNASFPDYNLSGAKLRDADLSGADLQVASLSETDLRNANLSGANLEYVNLSGATLRETDLSVAYLVHANLSNADLWRADLSGAKLQQADISGADLCRANLSRADFQQANLSNANLIDTDIHGAILIGTNLQNTKVLGIEYKQPPFILERECSCPVHWLHYAFWDFWKELSRWWTGGRNIMHGKYLGINAAECYGDAVFRRDAMDQDYIDQIRKSWRTDVYWDKIADWPRNILYSLLFWLWASIDYGRSFSRIMLWSMFLIFIFGYCYASYAPCDSASSWTHVEYIGGGKEWNIGVCNGFTPYYAAAISFSTLGFTDVIRATSGWGQFLLTANVMFGYIVLGLLMAVLSNTVARRS